MRSYDPRLGQIRIGVMGASAALGSSTAVAPCLRWWRSVDWAQSDDGVTDLVGCGRYAVD